MLAQALLVASLLYEVEPTRVPVSETRGASCMELHHPLCHNDIFSSISTASERTRGNANDVALAACAGARVEARELLCLDLLSMSAAASTGAQDKSADTLLLHNRVPDCSAQSTGRKVWASSRVSGLESGHAAPEDAAHDEPVRVAVRDASPASTLSTFGGKATASDAAGASPAIASKTSNCTASGSPAAGTPGLMADCATGGHYMLLHADSSATYQSPKPQCHGETKTMAGTQQRRRPPARAATRGAAREVPRGAAQGATSGAARTPPFCAPACDARATLRIDPPLMARPLPLPFWCAQVLPPPSHTFRMLTRPLARRQLAHSGVLPIARCEIMSRSSRSICALSAQ